MMKMNSWPTPVVLWTVVVLKRQQHADQPAGDSGGHEQPDLGLEHRHADLAGAGLGAADREDPVAGPGPQQDPGGDGRDGDPPERRRRRA